MIVKNEIVEILSTERAAIKLWQNELMPQIVPDKIKIQKGILL